MTTDQPPATDDTGPHTPDDRDDAETRELAATVPDDRDQAETLDLTDAVTAGHDAETLDLGTAVVVDHDIAAAPRATVAPNDTLMPNGTVTSYAGIMPDATVTADGAAPATELSRPRTRWAAIIWGLVFAVLAAAGLALANAPRPIDRLSEWVQQVEPVSLTAYGLLVVGGLVLVTGLVGLARRAQKHLAARRAPGIR
ncbi:hypothetical protein [Microbacterium sp. No. 7]|uniref:hypothetical protein n=1 Tax=Microbacterium sp. No. 7 TaxID=1714373 RepID=UPI0006ECD2D7|nr:hypothetical protein [Microbacterium sp. No. 7]ALJ19155.1 hypothetical protein AOA12_04250 [Microbacterium sp. No. 7]